MFSVGNFVQIITAKTPKILIVTQVVDEDTLRCSERLADGSYGTPRRVQVSRLALIPPYEISRDDLKALSRFENDLVSLAGMSLPENNVCPEPYAITPTDLLQALQNHCDARSTAGSFVTGWLLPVRTLLREALRIDRFFAPGCEDEEFYPLPVDDAGAFRLVWNTLCETADGYFDVNADAEEVFRLKDMIHMLEAPALEAGKPVPERSFSDIARRAFVKHRDNNELLSRSSKECVALFRTYTEQLCEENDPLGYTVKGYACYGGNAAFPENWDTARACMQKLLELDPGNAFPANTLGYIYYYGRCTGGIPQYEEAFQYFSIGAFAQIFESKYKAADMLLNGYGVPKNYEAARRLYTQVYNETLEQVITGCYESKFADAALRMGHLYRKGIGVQKDLEMAYRLYLQAEFAVRMRMNCCDYYGDSTVLASVRQAKREVQPQLPFRTDTTVLRTDHPWMLQPTAQGEEYHLSVRNMADGMLRLTARKAEEKDKPVRRSFVIIPECDYCDLLSSFVMYAEGTKNVIVPKREVVYTRIIFNDKEKRWVFLYGQEEVYSLKATGFIVRVQKPKPAEKPLELASVRFPSGEREYDYLRGGLQLVQGDHVIVPGNAGEEEAVVTQVYDTYDPYLPAERYKTIVRKCDKAMEEN